MNLVIRGKNVFETVANFLEMASGPVDTTATAALPKGITRGENMGWHGSLNSIPLNRDQNSVTMGTTSTTQAQVRRNSEPREHFGKLVFQRDRFNQERSGALGGQFTVSGQKPALLSFRKVCDLAVRHLDPGIETIEAQETNPPAELPKHGVT